MSAYEDRFGARVREVNGDYHGMVGRIADALSYRAERLHGGEPEGWAEPVVQAAIDAYALTTGSMGGISEAAFERTLRALIAP